MKELTLHIPLDKDEVHDIIDSLEYNHSLERLELSVRYHSQYFSESERQALDPRTHITMSHPSMLPIRLYLYDYCWYYFGDGE